MSPPSSLSADGRLAVSGSTDGTVHLWDVAGRPAPARLLRGHTGPVHSVALSADGRYALSGSALFVVRNDGERLFTSGQFKLWDTAPPAAACRRSRSHADAVTARGPERRRPLRPDGRRSVRHPARQRPFRPSPGRSTCGSWPRAGGCGTFAGHTDAVTSVCLSFDGRYALSGSTDRTVKLWEVADGQCLRTFAGHADAVTSVALSADGRHALSGSADRTLKLWILDWELETPPADWDQGARPHPGDVPALHTPYLAPSQSA